MSYKIVDMHIIIINHYALTPDKGGGTRHYQLARILVEAGHKVTLVASSYNHWSRKEEHLQPGETWKGKMFSGVECIWLKTPPYSNTPGRLWSMLVFAFRVRFGKWQETSLKGADIVLGSSPHLFAAYAAKKLADHWLVPYVLEIRDIWPQTLVELSGVSPRNPVIRIMRKIELFLYKNSALIITLLPGAAGYLEQNGADREKILWIPNCVDFDFVPDVYKPKIQDCFTIIYAGSVGYANGLDMLVDAAESLAKEAVPVCFKILGDGPEKRKLMQMVDEKGLSSITFCDPVPKASVFKELGLADACILILKDSPVFLHGISPNKLFDYMAVGRPILFAVNTPHNQVLEADCGITLASLKSDSLCSAVKSLVEMSPEKRWEMGQRGRDYVESYNNLRANGQLLAIRLAALVEEG